MGLNRIFLVILSVSGAWAVHAQLPSLDVQVKTGVTIIDDMRDRHNNLYKYISPVWHGELNWNVSQYVALGGFVAQGFGGETRFEGEYGSGNTFYNSQHLAYGGKVRLSSGRKPRLRPFGEINYGKFEMYIDHDTYRKSTTTNFWGWTLGLMIRVNSRLYLVIPQVSFRFRSDKFFFEVPDDFMMSSYPPVIDVTGGLSYNFGKKK